MGMVWIEAFYNSDITSCGNGNVGNPGPACVNLNDDITYINKSWHSRFYSSDTDGVPEEWATITPQAWDCTLNICGIYFLKGSSEHPLKGDSVKVKNVSATGLLIMEKWLIL